MRFTDEQLVQFMKQSGMATRVGEIEAFPWPGQTFAQLVQAMQGNRIIPAVLYNPDARHAVLSFGEKIFTDLLGYLIGIMPVAFLVGAIWTKQWLLLLGVPGFLAAAFVSNPWARGMRQFLMFASFVGAIVGFWKMWPIGFVCLGLLVSLWLAVFSREYINSIVKREAMKSEALFCYAFQAGVLLLRDASTGKIHGKR